MGTIAARQTREIVRNVRQILAIELLCAAQALDARRERPGNRTRQVYEAIRAVVPELKGDRSLSSDIAKVVSLVASGLLRKVLP